MLRLLPIPALLLLTGCYSGPQLPPLAAVSGVVTLDGQPVPRGLVQFEPDVTRGASGPPAVGEIGPDGRYTLKTGGEHGGLGAVIGPHRIKVEARALPKGDWDTLPASLVPAKYTQLSTSGLTAEVKAGQQNTVDLPLVSK